jgi:hypothetical protein
VIGKKKGDSQILGANLVLDLSKILDLILRFWLVSKLDINIRSLPIGFHTPFHTPMWICFAVLTFKRTSSLDSNFYIYIYIYIYILREPLTLIKGFLFFNKSFLCSFGPDSSHFKSPYILGSSRTILKLALFQTRFSSTYLYIMQNKI